MTLNPARLARFSDWAQTLPPRPLPRTVTPVPGEYYLDYISRLADANHLELAELTGALDDPAAVILDPGLRKRHRQERLAAAAGQPLGRIARLYWDDAGLYLRDPGGFRQLLRPACRRCTARRGIAGPIACRLPPHQTVCRRHRLWTGPAARTHAAQLDVSPFPEILRAQRRHLAQLDHHPWQHVETTISAATHAIYQALRGGTWIPGQRQRLQQLAPGTWDQALAGVLGGSSGRPDDGPGQAIVEIAIYPDVVSARRTQPPGAQRQPPHRVCPVQVNASASARTLRPSFRRSTGNFRAAAGASPLLASARQTPRVRSHGDSWTHRDRHGGQSRHRRGDRPGPGRARVRGLVHVPASR